MWILKFVDQTGANRNVDLDGSGFGGVRKMLRILRLCGGFCLRFVGVLLSLGMEVGEREGGTLRLREIGRVVLSCAMEPRPGGLSFMQVRALRGMKRTEKRQVRRLGFSGARGERWGWSFFSGMWKSAGQSVLVAESSREDLWGETDIRRSEPRYLWRQGFELVTRCERCAKRVSDLG